MTTPPRAFLEKLFQTAVAAAHPAACLPPHLPQPPAGRLESARGRQGRRLHGRGRGRFYLDRLELPASRLTGVAVARQGRPADTKWYR